MQWTTTLMAICGTRNAYRISVLFLLTVIHSQALSCRGSLIVLGESCYLFESIALKTFGDAMANCQSVQAHLVYIETSDEWNVIKDSLPKEDMWIGLSGLKEEEATWGDGYAEITYENFSPKAFDEMSGCFYIKDGPGDKWVSGPCLDLHGYICEGSPLETTPESDTTTTSSRHTSDSTSQVEMMTFSTSHNTEFTLYLKGGISSTNYTTDITSIEARESTSYSCQTTGVSSDSQEGPTTVGDSKEAFLSPRKLSQNWDSSQKKYYVGNNFILINTNLAVQNVTTIEIMSSKRFMIRCAALCIGTTRCTGFVGNQQQKYCSLVTNEQLEEGLTFINEDGAEYYTLENI